MSGTLPSMSTSVPAPPPQTPPPTPAGLDETRRLGVERTGIEIIAEAERTAQPKDLFWPWFAANISVFGISYAAFVLGFGISFWQAAAVTVIGVVVSFMLCGIIAIAGKRGSAPTMIRRGPHSECAAKRSRVL